MKIRLLYLFIFTFSIISFNGASQICKVTNDGPIRMTPYTENHNIVGNINKGTSVLLLDYNSVGYFKIKYLNNIYYLHEFYLDSFCTENYHNKIPFEYKKNTPKPSAPADLKFVNISYSDKEGNANNIIDAEEKSQIKFTINNSGKGKAYNVIIRIKTENIIKDITYPKEYDCGDLDAGQEKNILIPIRTGKDVEDGIANFVISASEANGFDPNDAYIKIESQKFINPQLKITDNIFSSENGGSATLGNKINLKIGIQNKGQGLAKNIKVIFNLPPENIWPIGDEMTEISELKAGEGKIVDFDFFTNKRYSEKEIPIKIELMESYGRYGEIKTVSVKLNQQLQQTNQVVVEGVKQKDISISQFSLLSDIDKNIPVASGTNPNAIAVVIGNSNYSNTKSVAYAISDAQSMKNYLINVLGFKEGNILFKENATLGDFNTLFGTKENQKGRLANTIKENISDVFIFYAGHGAPGLKDNKGYFVPVECNPNYVENSGYSLDVFYQNLAQLKVKSLAIVLDACFSGANVFDKISPLTIKVIDPVLTMKNAVVIASSSGTEVSTWYDEKQHGMFTYFFLKAIQDKEHSDKNKDGVLTYQELYEYVSDRNEGVPYQAARIHGIEQHPTITGNMKEKAFIKY